MLPFLLSVKKMNNSEDMASEMSGIDIVNWSGSRTVFHGEGLSFLLDLEESSRSVFLNWT